MTRGAKRLGEFALIAKYFAPLSRNAPGALNLTDDAASFAAPAGCDMVVTTDAVVAGIHFLADDPPVSIARKVLRVNLSDLAAKGATPSVYLLSLALPSNIDEDWLKSFAGGLQRDQNHYGITLVGGDTVAMRGPLTINVTAIGTVPHGQMLTRAGATAGDDIWVTGTIGDAGLGLRASKGEDLGLNDTQIRAVIARYRVPEPRSLLGPNLIGIANACLDVSDGLISDLGHMSDMSNVRIDVSADDVPLSPAAKRALAAGRTTLTDLLTAGDDYELAIAAPLAACGKLAQLAARSKTKLTRIGQTAKGCGVAARRSDGAVLSFANTGYAHF